MRVRNERPWEFTQLRRRMKSLSKGHKKKEQVIPLPSCFPPGVLFSSSISVGAIQQVLQRKNPIETHLQCVCHFLRIFVFFSGDRIALSIRAVKDELAYRRSCATRDSPHFPALISLVQHSLLPQLLPLLKSYQCVSFFPL